MRPATAKIFNVFRESTIYSIGNFLNKAVLFLMVPLYSHFIRPDDFYLNEILEPAEIVVAGVVFLGLGQALMRHVKAHQDDPDALARVTSTLVWFVVAVSVVVGGALWFWADPILGLLVSPHPLARTCYLLAVAGVVVRLFYAVATGYLQAQNRSLLLAGTILLGAVLFTGSNLVTLAFLGRSIEAVFWARVLLLFTPTLVVGFALLRPYVRLRFDGALLRQMVRFSYPFVLAALAYQVLNFFDRWMLDRLVAPEATSIYGMAYRFGMIPGMLLVTPFLRAWQPAMYEQAEFDVRQTVYRRVLLYYALCGALLWLGLAVFRSEVLVLFSEAAYYPGAIVIPYVAASQVFYGLGWIVLAGLAFEGKTLFIGVCTFAAAVLNIGLNLVLIPAFDILGAAVATTLSFVALFLGFAVYGHRRQPIRWPYGRLILMFAVSVAAFGLVDLLRFEGVWTSIFSKSLLLLPVVGLLVYLSGLTWAKVRGLFPDNPPAP